MSSNYSTQRKNRRIKRILGGQAHRWSFCPERLFYITPVYLSQKIAQEICQNYPDVNKVWDMFGGIGTDAVHLGPYFEKIYVSEVDEETYQCLRRNLLTFNKPNIVAIKSDCTKLLLPPPPGLLLNKTHADADADVIWPPFNPKQIDLVYFDPPWGDSYVANQPFDFMSVRLDNGHRVVDILETILRTITGNIVIKSPIKCFTFEKLLADKYVIKVLNYPEYKLKFILVRPVPHPSPSTPKSG